MNENELFISFQSAEEKYAFMKWLNESTALNHANDFIGQTMFTCIASCEYGKPVNPEENGENGYMELE